MARRRKIYLQDIKNEKICALPEDQSKLRIVDELCKKPASSRTLSWKAMLSC